jgi:pimeloyl-ACP methyl ester carboxylesterase
MKHLTVGDARFHVVDRGSGPPLLFVHGFPLDHQMWVGQIEALADEYRVIAPDLRGFGESESTLEVAPMEGYADDLARILDALEVTQPVTLCGLSMGGYIAWQFWKRHPGRLDKLILCDTRAAADTAEAAEDRRTLAKDVLAQGTSMLVDAMIPKLFSKSSRQRRADVVTATATVIRTSNRMSVAAALRGMAQRPDATPWLPHIRIPALVLCGAEDVITGVDEMKAMARQLPNATFDVVPDSGHMAPLENPDHVNRAIRRFLREARTATGS